MKPYITTITFFSLIMISGLTDVFSQTNQVIDIDGNTYSTVIIGEQEWMAENLRVTRYNNGDTIPTGLNNIEWGETTEGAYTIYNNDNNMLEAYGKLYNWSAVSTGNLCPAGWRVPTDGEWMALVDYVVGQGHRNMNLINAAGNALKSCRQQNHPDGGDCATSKHPRWDSDAHSRHSGLDVFGFSALPGGYRYRDGLFFGIGRIGFWWSSTDYDANLAWYQRLRYVYGNVYSHHYYKSSGFSVRCLKNN